MRTFIITAILTCLFSNTGEASATNLTDVLNRLRSHAPHRFTSYGYGNDDNNNYNYNNDDDNSNYNNDDDNSNYNNDDDNYSSGDDDNYSSGDDDNYNNYNDDDDSSEIPIDGGLGFLAAAGAGLGIKKLRDNRAKKKSESKPE